MQSSALGYKGEEDRGPILKLLTASRRILHSELEERMLRVAVGTNHPSRLQEANTLCVSVFVDEKGVRREQRESSDTKRHQGLW